VKLPHLSRILTRRPSTRLAEGLTTRDGLGDPDLVRAMQQYEGYLDAFRSRGVDVTVLDADDRFPDGHYVEDPAVIYGDMAFITHPGAKARADETQAIAAELAVHLPGHKLVVMSDPDARIEGGDVLFTTDRVLIGLSERTNRAGAEQLKAALLQVNANARVETVPLEGVLHLKTGMTELAPGVLLKDPHMKTDFDFSFAEVIELPPDEGYAANVVPFNEDFVLISEGFPTVADLAAKYYTDVVALPMTEFEKMDGSLTCLSLRF
jgi:dimethylargininase